MFLALSLVSWSFAYLEDSPSKIGPPPAEVVKEWKLSPFYKKYLDSHGLPILSSEHVSDAGLREAEYIVNQMLKDRPDIRKAIVKNKIRLAVMSPQEQTTDIPEHSDLTPKDYWDKRARGLGATLHRPAVSCGEENLLNLKGDRYNGENILVHEFAHVIHEMGLNYIDPKFDDKLKGIYKSALEEGLWKKTYAATNHKEYWAETVQSYFDCNASNNHDHNDINTRDKLAKYDPRIFQLIDEVFKKSSWKYVRYDQRKKAPKF
ncbi:hypothetical protein KIH39_23900 [Telmatocola sphagniphila]|uniref:Anthrax toxin lethal/endema factor N-/C-terminal domain-containing protein n=1 Tax=Telmatocola sphagniphila TaxID=1123043 RepID=A0A8E6B4K4_9BACT|nr:hypothetical protein [Telmatocola sphagniphila]QVL31843.1 hypothetical protein KIH39_23900 [Telmatocola sphagniphila]